MKILPALLCWIPLLGIAQTDVAHIQHLYLDKMPAGTTAQYWLDLGIDPLGEVVAIPVLIAKGSRAGPVLGITAAIHGDELNGTAAIFGFFEKIDPAQLTGTVVAVPIANVPAFHLEQREFPDGQDLNRIFPGKPDGSESEQYAWNFVEKVVRHFDILIDLHTASQGRINSHYVRADMDDPLLAALAHLQQPDIIVHNKGLPSAGAPPAGRTLRAEASIRQIPCITIEYGDPLVWQPAMIERGTRGLLRTLHFLGMMPGEAPSPTSGAVECYRSYWVYTDRGGLLEVPVELGQRLIKGELIGILRNAHGEVVCTYHAPEAGIVIGKSVNPVARKGARILHLGILR